MAHLVLPDTQTDPSRNQKSHFLPTHPNEKIYTFADRKYMTRQISIMLIVVLGFFLTPTLTYACGKSHTKTEKSCCDKKTSQTEKKDCCKNHTDNNQNNDGCGGKCKNASCHCPTAPLAFALTLDAGMKNHFIVLEKLTIGYTQSYISSGFHSIWQPPKIS